MGMDGDDGTIPPQEELGLDVQAKDERIDQLVGEIWGHAVKSITDVLTGDRYFGFKNFEAFADPSIEEIIHSIQLIEALVSVALNSKHFEHNHERTMTLLNSQQSIFLIRRTYAALQSKDQAEYETCIKCLQSQRQY